VVCFGPKICRRMGQQTVTCRACQEIIYATPLTPYIGKPQQTGRSRSKDHRPEPRRPLITAFLVRIPAAVVVDHPRNLASVRSLGMTACSAQCLC
jgi:hypothetical protein